MQAKIDSGETRLAMRASSWRFLYLAGGTAALAAVLLFRRYFSVEMMQFHGFGLFAVPEEMPAGAAEWFGVLQAYGFTGLLLLDLFDLVNYALVGLIFLALYGALRQTAKGILLLAMACAFAGITVYFASNQTFAMLNLSDRHAAATSAVEEALFLAAGEALLAIHTRGTGMQLSLFLVLVGGLLVSLIMLRSSVFNTAAATAGILANGIGLGYFIALPFDPAYIWFFPTFSAPFRMLWYILIAIKLFQLARVKHGS
jgi:hypothetical protein